MPRGCSRSSAARRSAYRYPIRSHRRKTGCRTSSRRPPSVKKWSMTVIWMENSSAHDRPMRSPIAKPKLPPVMHREVQPGHCQRNAAPVLHTASAAEQQAEQRHDQDVARGEESGLADRRIQQRELLGDAARAQRCAAAHTADNERFAGFAAPSALASDAGRRFCPAPR